MRKIILLCIVLLAMASCNKNETPLLETPPAKPKHHIYPVEDAGIFSDECRTRYMALAKGLEQHDHCEKADDCIPAFYGCHFPCYLSINKKHQEEVRTLVEAFLEKCTSKCVIRAQCAPENMIHTRCEEGICLPAP